MAVRRRGFLNVSASAATMGALSAAGVRPVWALPTTSASAANGMEQILSTDRVHVIEIKCDPKELHWLDEDREHKVACDVTIDGEKYKDANFTEKGDVGSSSTLAEKPSFTIRFGKDRPKV